MKRTLVKRYCGCNHKKVDYWCVCWFDGYVTGDAEAEFNRGIIRFNARSNAGTTINNDQQR